MDSVGDGMLIGTVAYDQAYAHRQHEETTWKHPRGGQAHYLSIPLWANMHGYLERIADHTLQEGGPRLGMIVSMELLARESASLAPIEIGTLRGSVHPSVEDNGVVVYDRPPDVPRLPDEVLDALHEMVWNITHPPGTPHPEKGP
jgi:hypothetical protein